eukprot:COSAG05_NODE_3492_length_2028_cov_6.451529_1_plen_68_part_10
MDFRKAIPCGSVCIFIVLYSCAEVINLAFSATLSKLVLLDSLIRLSESFLMMYRSGGRSRGPGGSISP